MMVGVEMAPIGASGDALMDTSCRDAQAWQFWWLQNRYTFKVKK